MYVTRISSRIAAEAITKAKARYGHVFGETLASNVGISLHGVKAVAQMYFATSPPIRQDPETPRSLIRSLAL